MQNLTAPYPETSRPPAAPTDHRAPALRSPYEVPSITLVGVWGMRTIHLSVPTGLGTNLGSLFQNTENTQ